MSHPALVVNMFVNSCKMDAFCALTITKPTHL